MKTEQEIKNEIKSLNNQIKWEHDIGDFPISQAYIALLMEKKDTLRWVLEK